VKTPNLTQLSFFYLKCPQTFGIFKNSLLPYRTFSTNKEFGKTKMVFSYSVHTPPTASGYSIFNIKKIFLKFSSTLSTVN
jgi:hypothetical protein